MLCFLTSCFHNTNLILLWTFLLTWKILIKKLQVVVRSGTWISAYYFVWENILLSRAASASRGYAKALKKTSGYRNTWVYFLREFKKKPNKQKHAKLFLPKASFPVKLCTYGWASIRLLYISCPCSEHFLEKCNVFPMRFLVIARRKQ